MEYRGSYYGPVLLASGAMNLHGQGYGFHRGLRLLGLNTDDTTVIMKTVTADPRPGNLPLKPGTLEPVEFNPCCIRLYPWRHGGLVLNKVGLSNPGVADLLRAGWWHRFPNPFVISFMAVGNDPAARLDETRRFVDALGDEMPSLLSPFILEVNESCPNTGTDHGPIDEITTRLEILGALERAIMVKVCATTTSPRAAQFIVGHPKCHGLSISNSIPFGALPEKIDWKKLYGFSRSPLERVGPLGSGGGAGSGPFMVPIACDWIKELRDLGCTKPLFAGGGIRTVAHAAAYLDAGGRDLTDITLGSIILSPAFRRIPEIVKFVRESKHEQTRQP